MSLSKESILTGVDWLLAAAAAGVALKALYSKRCCGEGAAKTVLVTGGTGEQGGSVIRFLLHDGNFKVRALTRDTGTAKAKHLEEKGVDVRKGNLNDKASVEAAARGADSVFLVTQFWENFSEAEEVNQGKTAIDACIAAGVKHIVLSTLPPAKKLAGIPVPHFDGKWTIAEYLMERAKATGVRYTFVFVPFYSENFVNLGMIRKDDKGNLSLALPMADKKWGHASVKDIGAAVVPVLRHPERYHQFLVDVFAEQITLADVATAYEAATGQKLAAQAVPAEVYAKFGFPGAEELAHMFQFFQWIADSRAKSSNPYVSLVDSTHYISDVHQLSRHWTKLKEFFQKNPVRS